MNKLTAEQLVMLNRKILADDDYADDDYADDGDIIAAETYEELKRITESPYEKDEGFFYKNKRTVEKAAKLGRQIAVLKPFAAANQETAVLAMLTLLDINGYAVANYGKDIDELCGYLEGDKEYEVCKWIYSHLESGGYKSFMYYEPQ